MPALLNFFLAVTLWVQVPQWNDDWKNCAVDVPDTSCHWYIVQADNTFGEGFDWETAPWYSIEGLQDIADLQHFIFDFTPVTDDDVKLVIQIRVYAWLHQHLNPYTVEFNCNITRGCSTNWLIWSFLFYRKPYANS